MSELRWCGYCESWHSKPCGEGCHWLPTDQTLEQMQRSIPNGMTPVYVKQWRTIILVPEAIAAKAARAQAALSEEVR